MESNVFCHKLQQLLPSLPYPPLAGELGVYIQRHYSAKVWQEWLVIQTKLINEFVLDTRNQMHKKFLQLQREAFLAKQEYIFPTRENFSSFMQKESAAP